MHGKAGFKLEFHRDVSGAMGVADEAGSRSDRLYSIEASPKKANSKAASKRLGRFLAWSRVRRPVAQASWLS